MARAVVDEDEVEAEAELQATEDAAEAEDVRDMDDVLQVICASQDLGEDALWSDRFRQGGP